MRIRRVVVAAAGALMFAGAGIAAAGNFSSSAHSDYFSPGEHQFYVWCAGSGDVTATETGSNAADAQLRLYDAMKARGRTNCWPLWQGRLKT